MNYEPLDSLPYIDEEITDLERFQIDQLIKEELTTQDLTQLHPSILSSPLIKEHTENSLGGISISRYNDLTNPTILQISIAYAYLQKQSSLLHLNYGSNQWIYNNSQLQNVNNLIKEEISNKRQRINQINEYRILRQSEVKPTLSYLSEQWEESIRKNLKLGVEVLSLRVKQKRQRDEV